MKAQKAQRILAAALLALLGGVFALWALRGKHTLAGLTMAALSCGLFGACAAQLVASLFSPDALEEPDPWAGLGKRSLRRRHPWLAIALAVLLSRAALYFFGYAVDLAANGYSGGMLDTLRALWLRTDSPSYLGIAENWYATEGDPRFHIVFFPLYPLCIRLCNLLLRDSFASAMLVSNLAAMGSGVLLYELAALDFPRRTALRAVLFLLLFPGSMFLGAPMTESLFLLLSLGCMLAVRRQRYPLAGLLGALAAFTRSVGVLLILPAAVELFFQLRRKKIAGECVTGQAWARGLCLAAILLGTGAYLYVNYAVTGDPLRFLTYQREHWSQSFGLFFSTAAYQTDGLLSAFRAGNNRMALGLFLPNLVCCFLALCAMLPALHKPPRLRPSYGAYFLAYYFVTIGATWLLSAPRYLAVCFPVSLACAALAERKPYAGAALALLLGLMMLCYTALYVLGYPVY